MSAWLVEEGLEGLVDKFTANNIDGTELLSLTKETLASELHIGEEDKHTLLSECNGTSIAPRSLTANACPKFQHSNPVLWGLRAWFLVRMNKDVCGFAFLCLVTWIKGDAHN